MDRTLIRVDRIFISYNCLFPWKRKKFGPPTRWMFGHMVSFQSTSDTNYKSLFLIALKF